MLKRIMVALAGLFLMLGLAAAPANGVAEADGSVTLFEDTHEFGLSQEVQEGDIPATCASIPATLSTVQSARNATSNTGTSISFYADSDCEMHLDTVTPGNTDPDINSPQGATFWQVTPPEE